MDARFELAPVGILEASPAGTVQRANQAAGDLLGIDPDAVAGNAVGDVFPDSVEASVPRTFEVPPEEVRTIEEYYPDPDRWLSITIVPDQDVVALYLEDETDRHRTRRRLESARADAERLTITGEVTADVLGSLVAASTRAEIAETICTRLGETDVYEFAWLGERELGTGEIAIKASAGASGRTLDRIETELDDGTEVPELRAVRSGIPEVVQSLGDDESVPDPVRRAAFADGLHSLLAVPLTYGSSVYGVVGIYASNRDAFSEREQRSFGTVGEVAGFAINATRNRSILQSDTVVELAFRLDDDGAPLLSVARERDVELTVQGLVPQPDHLLCYLAVEDGSPGPVADALDAADAVDSARVIADHGTAGTVEASMTGATPLGRLVDRGATLQSATFGAADARIVVHLPPGAEIRRVADAFTRDHDASVLAKRERDRDPTTVAALPDALDGRLTDRQEEALRTALFADYFESPRGSSAEEVADALGITGPTLLHHLRAGQRKLLEEVFGTVED